MSNGHTGRRVRLLSTALAAALLAATGAAAQDAPAVNAEIRIAAQPLDSAIDALASQTGLVIVAPGPLLDGLRSASVSGVSEPFEALGILLRGTNLGYRVTADGAVVIEPLTAQPSREIRENEVEAIQVTGTRVDPLNQLQTEATDSLTGLSRSLLETPRSASRVSEITIDRFGMEDVDDLLAAVPGTFTASFFGVPGNLNVRGTLADTYFQGFKRIENRGNFSSNLSAAAYVEVLRGPSSPIYGPGKVGGLLNFIPRTARDGVDGRYVDAVTGSVTVSGGSHDRRVVSGEVAIPAGQGGFHLFGEFEDSGSYYNFIEPEHTNIQATYVSDLGRNWSVELNAMYFDESGQIQTPGWNRVTQALIDDGTYITGRDTDLQDIDGDGYLSYSEIDAAVGASWGLSNLRQIKEFGGANRPEFALDTGVGTTTLDGSHIFADPGDYNDSETLTGYASLAHEADNGNRFAVEIFRDHIENQRYNSFGFGADYDATAIELRGSYSFHTGMGENVRADSVVGAAYRTHEAQQYESFLSGYIALDRRDLSQGPTATDRIALPRDASGEIIWDSRHDMEWNSQAVFAVSDITLFQRLSVLAGLRYDHFDVEAINTGATVFGTANTLVSDSDGATTWSLSVRYETPFGLTPYITYAEPRALESTQTGGVSVGTIESGLYISPSELREVGVKFSLLDGNLFGGLAYYEQHRRQADMFGNIDGTTAEGFEAEVHWLATDNLAFIGSATIQQTRVDAPGAGNGEYLQVRPDLFGVDPVAGYGGTFAFNNAGYFADLADGYELNTIPETVLSLFGTYTTDPFSYGGHDMLAGITAGATYVSETGGIMTGDIELPAYTLARMSGFLEVGAFTVSANIDNLFDERYFTPSAEVYKEVAVMPGLPRIFRINLSYDF
ncbi:MAG: TonB-dependent receptor [Oceanicaulis sp.]|uniref:TonB-dependent receptor n=1 Tax=Maricaulis virginensis TaxID=144022 RepID=A0A9W6MP41_9PROT|nr:TonB-dependent receptor [Maricaulis virginensis]MAZ92672.1 TonB-dependent receptor [Maricaulis sp.]MBI74821.1 TonB-dependent receptor [Oceanicaulis sp.]GLK53245.1 TonB-dependent receptor [Maricaulis virginensis]